MRNVCTVAGALLAACLWSTTARASVITIDFDNLLDVNDVAAVGSQDPVISGVTFQGGIIAAAGNTLNETEAPPRSGANVLLLDPAALATEIAISFATPVYSISGYFTYVDGLTLTAGAQSVAGSFASNLVSSGNAPNEYLSMTFTTPISLLTVSGQDAFTLDDFSFDTQAPDTSPTPVPEPATLTLLLTGGAAALARRRRA